MLIIWLFWSCAAVAIALAVAVMWIEEREAEHDMAVAGQSVAVWGPAPVSQAHQETAPADT